MKRLKQTLVIILSLIFILGGTGCMKVEGNNSNSAMSEVDVEVKMTSEEVKAMILQHLAKKYGKEFCCYAMEEPNILSDQYVLICYEAGKNPDAYQFKVIYTPGHETPIRDGYFGFSLSELIVDEVSRFDALSGNQVKAYVSLFGTTFPEGLVPGATLTDAINAIDTLDCKIFLFSDKPLDLLQIAQESKALGVSGWICFLQFDKMLLDSISAETYGDTVAKVVSKQVEPIVWREVEI